MWNNTFTPQTTQSTETKVLLSTVYWGGEIVAHRLLCCAVRIEGSTLTASLAWCAGAHVRMCHKQKTQHTHIARFISPLLICSKNEAENGSSLLVCYFFANTQFSVLKERKKLPSPLVGYPLPPLLPIFYGYQVLGQIFRHLQLRRYFPLRDAMVGEVRWWTGRPTRPFYTPCQTVWNSVPGGARNLCQHPPHKDPLVFGSQDRPYMGRGIMG